MANYTPIKKALAARTKTEATGAVFDDDRAYRFLLWRSWDEALPAVSYIMLNPSAADEHKNDPTITRSINLARASGFGRLYVVNLFAYMTKSPAELKKSSRPVAEDPRHNDRFIDFAVNESDKIVLAWGNHGAFLERHATALEIIARRAKSNSCYVFAVTKEGQPRHPLYTPKDIGLVPAPAQFWSCLV